MALRFYEHTEPCRYRLIDRVSCAILASAESAISPSDIFDGRFRSTPDVVFAADGSGVAISEDVSDASPIMRHILIHRESGGHFAVRYLQPPWDRFIHTSHPRDTRDLFSPERPVAIALTTNKISFYYPIARRTRVMSLASVPSTSEPPSE